jgi:alpha-beta hydrolase superfamily lysophospholipase
MSKYIKIFVALFLIYALASAAFAWYTTAPYRPSHQANSDKIGIPVEDVQVKASDGMTLRGWYSEGLDTGPAIAIFHGHRATRMEGIPIARALLLGGSSVLLMDFRGCGLSDGSTQHLGAKESLDIDAAVKYLHEKKGFPKRRIGIVAVGTGASAAILAKNTVRDLGAAVLIAPYATLNGSLDHSCRSIAAGLGVNGIGALFLAFVKVRIGQSTSAVRPLDGIAALAPCPVFLVGAANDKDSPPDEIQLMYTKAGEPKEMFIVPAAGRERLTDLNSSDLRKKLTDFFDTYMR